jgi:hypothetical protein
LTGEGRPLSRMPHREPQERAPSTRLQPHDSELQIMDYRFFSNPTSLTLKPSRGAPPLQPSPRPQNTTPKMRRTLIAQPRHTVSDFRIGLRNEAARPQRTYALRTGLPSGRQPDRCIRSNTSLCGLCGAFTPTRKMPKCRGLLLLWKRGRAMRALRMLDLRLCDPSYQLAFHCQNSRRNASCRRTCCI